LFTGELPLLVHGVGVLTIGPPGVGGGGAEPQTPSQALLQHPKVGVGGAPGTIVAVAVNVGVFAFGVAGGGAVGGGQLFVPS